jgi:hypothetical protein
MQQWIRDGRWMFGGLTLAALVCGAASIAMGPLALMAGALVMLATVVLFIGGKALQWIAVLVPALENLHEHTAMLGQEGARVADAAHGLAERMELLHARLERIDGRLDGMERYAAAKDPEYPPDRVGSVVRLR